MTKFCPEKLCAPTRLIQSAAVHIQRMQHALIQMNLHLHKVISDITGLTGMSIIRTIVAGERDPQTLAALKNSRIRSSDDEAKLSAAIIEQNWCLFCNRS